MTAKVAILTGAGSGIGRATAHALHLAGYSVILAGRRLQALEESAAGSKGTAPILCVPTDVTDGEQVAALFARARAEFGRVDLLFNNAGTSLPSLPLDELAVEQLWAIIKVNIGGAMLCAREAMKVMKAQAPQGGRIINNGSISAYGPRPNSAGYTASKHAMTGLTKSIILDGRHFNISCGQIDIGNAATDMTAAMATGVPQADGTTRPEPRVDVGHVANTIVHMASLPPEANIPFLTIMATNMPLYGRG